MERRNEAPADERRTSSDASMHPVEERSNNNHYEQFG
jgi:hypothetical protein